MRLSKDDVVLLHMFEGADDAAPAGMVDVPKAMFEFNLISRLPSGELRLTRTGARALFQAECIVALEQSLEGGCSAMASGVERWLVSSGFLQPADKTVTARGKLWLASLSPEQAAAPAPPPCAEAMSEQFAARRGAA